MRSALIRYRVVAYIVGALLLLLTMVAMPLKYLPDPSSPVAGFGRAASAIVAPAHGFLFMVYLVVGFQLSIRQRWAWGYTALVLLAGTVPFLTFIVERGVTRRVRAAEATAGTSV